MKLLFTCAAALFLFTNHCSADVFDTIQDTNTIRTGKYNAPLSPTIDKKDSMDLAKLSAETNKINNLLTKNVNTKVHATPTQQKQALQAVFSTEIIYDAARPSYLKGIRETDDIYGHCYVLEYSALLAREYFASASGGVNVNHAAYKKLYSYSGLDSGTLITWLLEMRVQHQAGKQARQERKAKETIVLHHVLYDKKMLLHICQYLLPCDKHAQWNAEGIFTGLRLVNTVFNDVLNTTHGCFTSFKSFKFSTNVVKMQRIAKLFPKLEILDHITCDNEGLACLSNLRNLKELHLQDIPRNGFGNLRLPTSLTKLYLFFTDITSRDPDFSDLADLKRLTNLEALSLACTSVTDKGLKNVSHITSLRTLNLSFCKRITDKGLKQLRTLSELTILYLSKTNITDEGAAVLGAALPKLKIFKGFAA